MLCYIVGYLITYYILNDQKKFKSFNSLLYNIFISGMIIATFLSLQGAYYNPIGSISVNSLFYILGIALFVGIVLEAFYSIYSNINESVIPFHKVRIIFKCVGLSLAYLNPLYIFMSIIFLDFCLLVVDYILKKEKKVTPKLWLFNNILVDIGLCLMILGPYLLITVFMASFCIIIVIGIEIYIMIKENSEF